ncbi:NUDIX domain-containing protein [Sphingomonas lacunae]|uniref:NUDIX domain-containing protein n=1 Tax=Sphingomonas lacunae TaxID=2698828 RepID=A0A6M4ATM4_9SPHN|nr:NUDIX domain-containing protein [Sphingomonas lacunae]QJQ31672.1 NUDIX domain-containing protein [Sphingomonas lacunae]
MNLRTAAYTLAHSLRLLWWRVRRPNVYGTKAIILNDRREVLLVRHTYAMRDLYMLPGGGYQLHEDPALAAAREVVEETGVELAGPLCLHGAFVDAAHGARNHIHVYVGRAAAGARPVADGREIAEAAWFPLDDLPANLSGPSARRIIEVRDGQQTSGVDWRT